MADMYKLFKQFDDEIEGCIEYSKCAAEAKNSDPQLCKMYTDMASAELQHATMLHNYILSKTSEKSDEPYEQILDEIWAAKKTDMFEMLARAKAYSGML